jgi:hypothetical protein
MKGSFCSVYDTRSLSGENQTQNGQKFDAKLPQVVK